MPAVGNVLITSGANNSPSDPTKHALSKTVCRYVAESSIEQLFSRPNVLENSFISTIVRSNF